MSAFDSQALDAIASQLVTTFDRYQASTAALVRDWPDMEQYRVVSGQIDEIRAYCAGLPTLSVQFVTLLISHAELIHSLWKAAQGPDREADLAAPVEQHGAALAHLRTKALRLLPPAAPRH